jgi:arylsulfatase A-like enzyme
MAGRSNGVSLALGLMGLMSLMGLTGALLAPGCREQEPPIAYELTELLPEAWIGTETASIDFGAASARPSLGSGWSSDESAADGTSFVWAVGPSSSVDFVLSEPKPVTLLFRAWPFHYDSAPAQTVSFELNGSRVGSLALSSAPGEYRLSLPPALQRPGDNILSISYGYHHAPRDVVAGSGDARSLAVGWDWMRFEGVDASEPPRAITSGDEPAIVLPPGSTISYYLDVTPESALDLDGVRALSDGSGRRRGPASLRVEIATSSERLERTIEEGVRTLHIPLPRKGGWVRLRFQPVSDGLVLWRPTVRAPVTSRSPSPVSPRPVEPPDIVVILIDTLRADHLGCYGYQKATTPNLDALASDATLFENAVAQSSWTRPSVTSIMTGLTPRAHQTNARDDALPAGVETLAQRLAGRGYETAGFVTNTNVASLFGFDRGFGTYELLLDRDPRLGYARADALVARALEFLSRRKSDAPLFLYLHATDPHDPYSFSPSEGEGIGTMPFMKALEAGDIEIASRPGLREELIARYDREIRFVDKEIGRFLQFLKERGRYDDALVVVVSDHGEEFDEHGWWRHGKTLYQEQLHVPLLVKWPGGAFAGKRVSATAQHIDLLPTLLDISGQAPSQDEGGLPGRSLWRVAAGEAADAPAVARSYLRLDGREVESVTVGGQKLVRYFTYDREKPAFELFDLRSDPSEKTNRAGEEFGKGVDFLRGLLRLPPRGPEVSRAPVHLDEETERRLRALGYVR